MTQADEHLMKQFPDATLLCKSHRGRPCHYPYEDFELDRTDPMAVRYTADAVTHYCTEKAADGTTMTYNDAGYRTRRKFPNEKSDQQKELDRRRGE